MDMPNALRACACCGLVQRIGPIPPRFRARCARCGSVVRHAAHPRSAGRAAAFALAALILYPAAMTLPVIRLEQMGHERAATIWSGVVELLSSGYLLVGIVVLICSVIAPLGKILAIFAITGPLPLPYGRGSDRARLLKRRHRAATYRLVEWIGRWGMLDVLLVALLVAAVKLGDWVNVHPGPGVAAFAGVVVLSLLASAAFDPHAIWEE
jgi:paraquat-inducible protein A